MQDYDKKSQEAAKKIQAWWRGILVRTLMRSIKQEFQRIEEQVDRPRYEVGRLEFLKMKQKLIQKECDLLVEMYTERYQSLFQPINSSLQ